MWKLRLKMLYAVPDVTQLPVEEEPEPTLSLTWPLRPSPDWDGAHLELRPQQESQTLEWLSLRYLQSLWGGAWELMKPQPSFRGLKRPLAARATA